MNNNISWLEKYRPSNFKEYLNYQEYKPIVKAWIEPFLNKEQTSRPFLVLYGPPAYGKTTLSHCIFNEYDYEIMECNASDIRNKKQLEKYIRTGKYSFSLNKKGNGFKPYGLVLDELDGLSCGDNGGVEAIMNCVFLDNQKIIKGCKYSVRYPVICTTNSIKEKKLQKILKFCHLINMTQPSKTALYNLGKKIISREKICISLINFKSIITVDDDFRSIIKKLNNIHLDSKNKKSKQDVKNYISNYINNLDNESKIIRINDRKINDITEDIITNFDNYDKDSIIKVIDNNSKAFYMTLLCNYYNIIDNYPEASKIRGDLLNIIDLITVNYDLYNKNKSDNADNIKYIIELIYCFLSYIVIINSNSNNNNRKAKGSKSKQKRIIKTIKYHKKYNDMKQNNSYIALNINKKNRLSKDITDMLSNEILNKKNFGFITNKNITGNSEIYNYLNADIDITHLLLTNIEKNEEFTEIQENDKKYKTKLLGITESFESKINNF